MIIVSIIIIIIITVIIRDISITWLLYGDYIATNT